MEIFIAKVKLTNFHYLIIQESTLVN